MGKKTKKVSETAFEKTVNENMPEYSIGCEWNGFPFTVKRWLSLSEAAMFVDTVYGLCFNEEGMFAPQYKDYAVRAATVALYTDIALPVGDAERTYSVIYRSGIFEQIRDEIDTDQFGAILRAIEDKIRVSNSYHAEMARKQMTDILSSLEETKKWLSGAFGDIDSDDVKKIISAFSANGIDERKLAESFMGNGTNAEE